MGRGPYVLHCAGAVAAATRAVRCSARTDRTVSGLVATRADSETGSRRSNDTEDEFLHVVFHSFLRTSCLKYIVSEAKYKCKWFACAKATVSHKLIAWLYIEVYA